MKRWLLLVASWGVACASVLGIRPQPDAPFPHRAHVIQGVPCSTCHPTASEAKSTSPVVFPSAATCVRCHVTPHDPRECSDCHGQASTRHRVELARTYLRFDHVQHARDGTCVRCHDAIREADAELLPRMGTCLSCHAHDDDFEVRDCDRCHVDLHAETVRPSTHVVHGQDFTQQHGAQASASADLCKTCHTERDCASCHGVSVPALPWRLALETERAGLHRAGFVARHATEARLDPGACASCHSNESCQSCHVDRGVAAGGARAVASPHPADWVRGGSNRHGIEARRDPMACASCHGGAGEALCVGCHRVGGVGGSVHPPGFVSNLDRLRDRPCIACHLSR